MSINLLLLHVLRNFFATSALNLVFTHRHSKSGFTNDCKLFLNVNSRQFNLNFADHFVFINCSKNTSNSRKSNPNFADHFVFINCSKNGTRTNQHQESHQRETLLDIVAILQKSRKKD